MALERLQKILSAAGVASRRKAEQLIVDGRVTVNGAIVSELGSRADFDTDHIKVDGKLLHRPKHLICIALNKPVGYVTTVSDPQHRETVMDLLRGVKERVYPVGRLDYHSEGLLLLTNDGELANAVTSAVNHVAKTYLVKINGTLTADQEEAFRHGLPIEGRMTKAAGVKLVRRAENPWYEVRLFEGRKNQIRMMFRHLGFLVEKLKRVQVGNLSLGSLKPGEFRYLDSEEIERFKRTLVAPARSRREKNA
jgi:23S rRNA pseudouridine2605 synthase